MDGEPRTLSGWSRFVLSPAALRFAAGKVDLGIDIPPLSDDPLRQWLLEEAMVLRLLTDRANREHDRQEEADAHARAREELDRIAPR